MLCLVVVLGVVKTIQLRQVGTASPTPDRPADGRPRLLHRSPSAHSTTNPMFTALSPSTHGSTPRSQGGRSRSTVVPLAPHALLHSSPSHHRASVSDVSLMVGGKGGDSEAEAAARMPVATSVPRHCVSCDPVDERQILSKLPSSVVCIDPRSMRLGEVITASDATRVHVGAMGSFRVAVKVYTDGGGGSAVQRLLAEAQAAGRVRHANVLNVLGVCVGRGMGRDGAAGVSRPSLVMELAVRSLRDDMQSSIGTVSQGSALVAQCGDMMEVLRGLETVHNAG